MPHLHELIDFTVEVFLVCKTRVLLRKHDKYNIWLSVGGHIEAYEDPNEAAIREVREEVGLEITLYDTLRSFNYETTDFKVLIPPYFLSKNRINDKHSHVTFYYFAKTQTEKIQEMVDREKSAAIRWFSKEELENLTDSNENIRQFALKALDVVR